MSKLRVLTLVSLLLLAVGSACALPDGTENISIEDAIVAGSTIQAVAVESAVEATVQAQAVEATLQAMALEATLQAMAVVTTKTTTPALDLTVVTESPLPSGGGAPPPAPGPGGGDPNLGGGAPPPAPGPGGGDPNPGGGAPPPAPGPGGGQDPNPGGASLPSPVVQVATPTSIVSASIPTVIPTATVAITPVPVPTPIPTPEPIKIQFRDGAFNIPNSFEYFELNGFRVENVKELNASGGVSASVKWGDSNEWFGVPIDAETGEILAGHMYRSGGTFYADIKITSESGELFLHSFSIFVNGAVTVIQTPPTPIPTIGPSPTPTSTPIPGATATATPTPTSTPTVGPTPTPTVTPTSVPLADPVYDKIVFTAGSNEDGSGRTDIWMIDPDGSNKTNLTNTPDCVRERDAYISPSGRQIYLGGEWECYESGGPGVKDDAYRRGMRVMHPDGSNIVRLTDYGDEPGSLSPDGTKMVFRGARRAWSVEGQTGAWIMNADGSNQTRLVTWGPGDEQFCGQSPSEDSLSWSPDGTKILFTASRLGCYGWSDAERIDRYGADSVPALPVDTGNHAEIYVMNADGSNVTRLTVTDQPSWSSKAAWSPDGNKITYASSQGSYPATSIWVMDADGSNPIDLNVSGSRPSWSPDGTKIVFDNNPNGIYVMNADGTNVVQLSSTGISPHWGPAAP